MYDVLKEYVTVASEEYGAKRKYAYKSSLDKKIIKRINPFILGQEVTLARMLGEFSAAERILAAIVEMKDWDRSEIEAEVHLFMDALGGIISERLEGEKKLVDLEDILRTYYTKEKEKKTDGD